MSETSEQKAETAREQIARLITRVAELERKAA